MPTLSPTLIIQLQRMGDLIMSFPLITRLRQLEPERPVWVLAEPRFFRELMPLTPAGVVYMGPDMVEPLATTPVHRVVNLSHRPEAHALAGRLAALCPGGVNGVFAQNGVLHTRGAWALYRQSIVHNNRHNRFHWADLHNLGLVPPALLATPAWEAPRPVGEGGKIGLFVGASEPEKRPDAAFWGELARRLIKKGLNPVFLGGPDDRALAHEANQRSGLPGHNNLAGQFSLSALTGFVRTLDLVVSPDTGPMHLSAWAGVPVLNLSMGPVNPWETGPVPPGHHVLRPTTSCAGCWHCQRGATCRNLFVPGRVATLVAALVRGDAVERFAMPGLALYRTGRRQGLYDLAQPDTGPNTDPPQDLMPRQARDCMDGFWQEWFLAALGGAGARLEGGVPARPLAPSAAHLAPLPALRQILEKAVSRVNQQLAHSLRRGGEPLPGDFWAALPPLARPLAGYLHLVLQNGEYERAAFGDALTLTAHLLAFLANEEPPAVTLTTL